MPADPVCGMEVELKSAKEQTTYEGQTYYFCSLDCRQEFDESPEDYIGDEGMERTGT